MTAEASRSPEEGGDRGPDAAWHADRPRGVPVREWVGTVLAGLVLLVVLLTPNQLVLIRPRGYLALPFEAVLGAAVLLLLPARARRVAAVLGGLALGLLAVIKLADEGFTTALGRPFDPVLDWPLVGDGISFVTQAFGRVGAVGALAAATIGLGAVVVLAVWAVLRLTRDAVLNRSAATRLVAVLCVGWLTCSVFGAHLIPGVPVASTATTALIVDRAEQVSADVQDKKAFAAVAGQDHLAFAADRDLLTRLRGKQVVLAFVESYGRVAVEDPELSPGVDRVLEDGNRRLAAAGFASRSAFLTSPTAGGGSWLAQSTLLSGLWIDTQQRYRTLVSSNRQTLTGAFGRAGWRTVGVMPGNTSDWPERRFFHLDQVYDAAHLGYRGPAFSWATMPDQYTLSAYQRLRSEGEDGRPTMAEIPLVSSHAPWSPLPRPVAWRDVGDGSIFDSMAAKGYPPQAILTRNAERVRKDYGQSIQYSLSTLISYVLKYGDDNLVLVFLGDHQPSSIVTGADAGRDVPITIVSRDHALLAATDSWHWQAGLDPSPSAPVWRMDTFRDRFLTTFGR